MIIIEKQGKYWVVAVNGTPLMSFPSFERAVQFVEG
jgi:hypothetical protein